jgi:hypothetical protein
MYAWFSGFNQSKKLDEILQRFDMSDEEFLHRLQISGEVALKTVRCCRTELGKTFRVPPEKLYPNDIFRDIVNLPASEWDMLELVFSLEKTLSIGIDEEQVPDWICRDTTLGKWIINFLRNVEICSKST